MDAELDRFEALVSELLDGALDAAGRGELARLAASDPERLRVLLEQHRAARQLAATLAPGGDGAAFARRVLRELQRDRTPFTVGVMRDLRAWRRRRAIAAFTLAAAAGVVLAAGALRVSRTGAGGALARLERAGPGVTVLRGDREIAPEAGFGLRPGDRLRTGGRATARIAYVGEPTVVEVEAWSDLVLGAGERGKWIHLRKGEVRAEVAPQPPGRPLVIRGWHARAEVLGTRLVLSAVPDATRLAVEDGRVRLVREADGAAVEVPARHFALADTDSALVAEPLPPASAGTPAPAVLGFRLIQADRPRAALPGFEALEDGAVIDLARLPTRRINLEARTIPERVGSVRFTVDGAANFNTELNRPYTLLPGTGRGGPAWAPAPGRYRITATPFGGSYGNGARGSAAAITLTIVDSASGARP